MVSDEKPRVTLDPSFDAEQRSRKVPVRRPSCYFLSCCAVLVLCGCRDRVEQIVESPREKAATVWHISQTQPVNATDKSGLVSFEASLIERTVDPTKSIEAVVKVNIKRGSYVYGDVPSSAPFTPLAIRGATEETAVSVGDITLPITTAIEGGKPVYRDSFSARIPMHLTSSEDGTFTLCIKIEFQACNDLACFPPEEVVMQLPLLVKRSPSL